MLLLGWKYDNLKKVYYVDGNESAAQQFHRFEFGTKYMTEWEPQSPRWLQEEKKDFDIWKEHRLVDHLKELTTAINHLNTREIMKKEYRGFSAFQVSRQRLRGMGQK